METGVVGLGRMGANMARRMMAGGHRVVVSNRSPAPIEQLASEGAVAASSRVELKQLLSAPRSVWVVLPSGDVTEQAVEELGGLLDTLLPNEDIQLGVFRNKHVKIRRPDGICEPGGSATSTRARAAASGGWRTDTASW